jgi:hypothetical protein
LFTVVRGDDGCRAIADGLDDAGFIDGSDLRVGRGEFRVVTAIGDEFALLLGKDADALSRIPAGELDFLRQDTEVGGD